MPVHDVAFGLFLCLAVGKDMVVSDSFYTSLRYWSYWCVWETLLHKVEGMAKAERSWTVQDWQSAWPLLVLGAAAAAA